jgi:preprotein translocase subunit SecA
LGAQLEKCAGQSEMLNAFLVSPLLDLEAREALPTIERAFAAGCVDAEVVGDYEAVEIALGVKTQRQRPPQPNALTRMAEKLQAIAAGGQPSDASPDAASGPARLQPYLSPGKPGRNDPCPCGSGKKHKKCCGK